MKASRIKLLIIKLGKGAEKGLLGEENLGVEKECIPPSDIRMFQHILGS